MKIESILTDLHRCGYFDETSHLCGSSLSGSMDRFTPKDIVETIQSRWLGRIVCFLREVDSTNDLLVKLAEQAVPQGTVVVADFQTAGKGRQGRTWSAPPQTGLLFSYLIYLGLDTQNIPLITLAAAVGTARGLHRLTGIRPGIKWPNDIIVNGKKICGILAESRLGHDLNGWVIVGIGINVHIQDHEWPEDLRTTAASIFQLTDKRFTRNEVFKAVCEENEKELEVFFAGDTPRVIQNWKEYSVTLGEDVDVFLPTEILRGNACGITSSGGLMIREENGTVRTIYMGEISIRHVNKG